MCVCNDNKSKNCVYCRGVYFGKRCITLLSSREGEGQRRVTDSPSCPNTPPTATPNAILPQYPPTSTLNGILPQYPTYFHPHRPSVPPTTATLNAILPQYPPTATLNATGPLYPPYYHPKCHPARYPRIATPNAPRPWRTLCAEPSGDKNELQTS